MKRNYLHYIYKTTCLITGKYYIGMHRTYKEDDGYIGSGLLLKRSIKKYGFENHKFEILEYCDSVESLCKREEEIINEELLQDKLCMNLKLGGIGGATMTGRKMSQETKGKISKSRTGIKHKEETKKRISEKVSETLIGNQRAKGNKNWLGKKHTEESKLLMRDNHPFVKKVEMYDSDNNFIQEFNSLREAENITGILRKHISRCCRGLAKTAGKHIWKFKTI